MKRGRTASHAGAFDSRRIDNDAIDISMICVNGILTGALECAEMQTRQVPLARSSCGCRRWMCTACSPTSSARKTTHTGTSPGIVTLSTSHRVAPHSPWSCRCYHSHAGRMYIEPLTPPSRFDILFGHTKSFARKAIP